MRKKTRLEKNMQTQKNKLSVRLPGFTITLLVISSLFITTFSLFSHPENSENNFAVVELFTSEGCSSCPPADKVLSGLISEARDKNLNIYGLSFHVDYWDYIGWKDPYSDNKYSRRQRQYAQAFKTDRIYTPQMIVNGQKEFIGSSQSKAQTSIRDALAKPASVKISLQSKLENQKLQIDYSVAGLPTNAMVHLALVESGLAQDIKSGENRGRVLKHDNVVRDFQTFQTKKGQATFHLSEVENDNTGVIIYVQDQNSMKILGAKGIYLSELQ